MNTAAPPTTEQILAMMETQLGRDGVPQVMRRAGRIMPDLLAEHVRGKMYAMPPVGAFDEETQTLIYLAAALASGSTGCVKAMAARSRVMGIAREKLLETFRIARLAVASGVIGNAEPLLAALDDPHGS